MFRKSKPNDPKKNYLELNIRASYDPETDSIQLTSKDHKIPSDSSGFHLTLTGGNGIDTTVRTMLMDAGLMPDERTLPTELAYEEIAESPWYQFPLGQGAGAETIFWEPPSSSNLLITGPAGSGKSAIERSLILHCLRHPDKWSVYAIDPWRELSPYKEYAPVKGIVHTIGDAVEMLRSVRDEVEARYEKMEALGVNNYRDLPDEPPAILLIVDEIGGFLSMSGMKSQAEEDQLRGEAALILSGISRMARAAGVHLALTTQQPNTILVDGDLQYNITTKIVMGRVDAIHSHVVVGCAAATRIPSQIKGRAYIRSIGGRQHFQTALVPDKGNGPTRSLGEQ